MYDGLVSEHGLKQVPAEGSSRGTPLGTDCSFGQKYESIKERDYWSIVVCGG